MLGLSGGIDSSLTACIAVDALGSDNVHGVSMPSKYSSEHSKDDAKELAQKLGIDYQVVSIESIIASFEHSLKASYNGTQPGVAEENIQSRATTTETHVVDEGLRAYMLKVYNYMATGVLLTGIIALLSFKVSVVTDSAGAITAINAAYLNEYNEIPSFLLDDYDSIGGFDGFSGNQGYNSSFYGIVNLSGAVGNKDWIIEGDIPIVSMHGDQDDVVQYDNSLVLYLD